MLCFDIETTGLKAGRDVVTVVCAEDFATGARTTYEFYRYKERYAELRQDLIEAFDAAHSLCAFNGVRFDLPFLAKFLSLGDDVVARWAMKTSDILEQSRLRYKTTFSLNMLCQHNGIPVKISDGKEAINMAHQGRFDELNEYCAMDVSILCDIYRKKFIRHPRSNVTINLKNWARDGLYSEHPGFLHYARQTLDWTPEHCARLRDMFRNIHPDHDKVEACRDRVWDAEKREFVLSDNELSETLSNYECALSACEAGEMSDA